MGAENLRSSTVYAFAARRDKNDEQLKGLVYSLTLKTYGETGESWWKSPVFLGLLVLLLTLTLNVIFW